MLSVQIELLSFEGCPSADAFLPRLRELLAETGVDAPVQLNRVESVQDAERERVLGSPTLRVNGHDIDPDAAGREDFGLKCRLYPTPAGMAGTPPDDWVRRALQAATEQAVSDGYTSIKAAAITGAWALHRLAGLTSAQRGVHRRILRAIAAGVTPTREQLAGWTAGPEGEDALAVLAARDLVHRDPQTGAVAVAYPFSGRPTAHRVRMAAGVDVYAMCAIDALGITFMLDQPTRVRSTDPTSGEPITITMTPDGHSDWSPADAVVVLACSPGPATSAQCACPHTNFAASARNGQHLLATAAGACGSVLSMPDAIALGSEAFGALLTIRDLPGPAPATS